MNARITVTSFLQSQLGLLLITSVLVPLFTFSYQTWRDHVAADSSRILEKRIILYRTDVVLHSLAQETYPGLRRAFDALQGKSDYYRPLYPDLETDIPLNGLLYRVLPLKTLRGEHLPEPVETLALLAEALLPMVGPDTSSNAFAAAYAANREAVNALRERLSTEYTGLKAKLK